MSARDDILHGARARRPAGPPLPDVAAAARGFRAPPGDAADRFTELAAAAGARVVQGRRSELPRLVGEAWPGARRVLSLLPEVPGTVSAVRDPHDLADLDLLVCEALLGVAENGAVWLTDSCVGTRAALFLPAHVVVVLERAAIVDNLHQAYARLDPAAEGFGAFVAGPSKTADIEQSLVVGAHGPRGLTIVLTIPPGEGGDAAGALKGR